MNAAPALAARIAWPGEKHRVTLTITPRSLNARQVLRPSGVSGTLMAILGAMAESTSASASMALVSVAVTSALTGPVTTEQISAITS